MTPDFALILSPFVPREEAEAARERARRAESAASESYAEGVRDMERRVEFEVYDLVSMLPAATRRALLRDRLEVRIGARLADALAKHVEDHELGTAIAELVVVAAKENL